MKYLERISITFDGLLSNKFVLTDSEILPCKIKEHIREKIRRVLM